MSYSVSEQASHTVLVYIIILVKTQFVKENNNTNSNSNWKKWSAEAQSKLEN